MTEAASQRPSWLGTEDFTVPPAATEFAPQKTGKYEKAFQMQVPLPFVISRVSHRMTSNRLYTDLIIYVPFLIMFVFFAYGGRGVMEHGHPYGIVEGYYTTAVLKDIVLGNELQDYQSTKTFEDVKNAQEWHSWFSTVLVPNIFQECGEGADPTPPDGPRILQGKNYLLGAMRVRAQRASNRSCELSPDLFGEDPVTGQVPQEVLDRSPCYGLISDGEQTELLFGFRNELVERQAGTNDSLLFQWKDCDDLEGGQSTLGFIERSYHCGGYITDVAFEKPCYTAEWLAEKLRPDGSTPLVDNVRTRFVIVEFFVYSPVHNGFTSVKIFAEVSAAGSWLPQYQIRNFLVWTSAENTGETIFDFFFFAFVLYFCYVFTRDLMAHRSSASGGSIASFIVKPWNLLEFLNLICFLVSFAFRWAWWDVSMQSDGIQFPYAPKYPSDLDRLLTYYSQQTYANSINITVSLLKVLKYLRLNPRLGILTSTIDRVKVQLLGVLVLFAWAVLAYALAGFSLYGSALWEFHTVDTAYTTLLRMLAGDFESIQTDNDEGLMELRVYPRMRTENRVLTFAFFFSYLLLVFFFLLNMMIGILGLGFSELNSNVATIPLSEEISRFFSSLRRSCRPARIKSTLVLMRTGKSITTLLTRAHEHMYEHQRLVKGEDRDVDDSKTLLRRSDLAQYIGVNEYKALGVQYCDDLWYEIAQEWEDAQLTDEVIEMQALEGALVHSIDEVVDPAIDQVRTTQGQLTKFEAELRDVISILSTREKRR
eukprot:TRINITY_DN24637_c0_g1_i1.p1 TRINITY_DN24637_c0_g1~~TRINITY_DN24637_c0_g1_i1.p1  ORF type:complete len:764 (+),score=235.90 TRINITY_DN24637_c0_g1_i1:107-2398(+)